MIYTATITSKGQVTIPLPVRQYMGWQPSQKINFFLVDDQEVRIKKQEDFWALAGSVDSQGIVYSESLGQKAIKKHVLQRYVSS